MGRGGVRRGRVTGSGREWSRQYEEKRRNARRLIEDREEQRRQKINKGREGEEGWGGLRRISCFGRDQVR